MAPAKKEPTAKPAAKKETAASKATPPKKAPAKRTTRRKPKQTVNTTPSAQKESRFEIDYDVFTNVSEWELYHVDEYVRAKQVTEPCYIVDARKHAVPGDYVIVNEAHEVSVLGKESFEKRYVIIKGPHKRAF